MIWNDQTYYWHQILTFSHAGFNGGYYMFYEKLPGISFFHFGASGFLYPALYGTVAHFVGWEPYTGILLNMVLLALAVLALIYTAQFDRLQIVLTGLLLLSIAPILLYLPTISQESFHQAAAIIMGAIFYQLFRHNGNVSRRLIGIGIGCLVIISLVRFSWILLILPFFLLSQKKWTWRSLLFACFISGVFAVLILLIFQNTSAPGNNSVFSRLGALSSSPLAGLQSVWNAVVRSLESTFTVRDFRQFPFEFAQFFMLFFCLLLGGRRFFNHGSMTTSTQLYFHLYNLISILGASLIFYLSAGYVRVFTPYIILSGVLLVAARSFRLVSTLIIVGLLGVGVFLATYRDWDSNFVHYSPAQIVRLKQPFERFLIYDDQAANPWCNTLMTSVQFLNLNATFVPPGIGISFFVDPAVQPTPLKSRYVLLDDHSYAVLQDRLNLAFLTSVNGSKLYHNLDADCK